MEINILDLTEQIMLSIQSDNGMLSRREKPKLPNKHFNKIAKAIKAFKKYNPEADIEEFATQEFGELHRAYSGKVGFDKLDKALDDYFDYLE